METIDADPTDSRLAVLLDPEGRSVSLCIEESPTEFTAHPCGYPLWFVATCVLTPVGLFAGYLLHKMAREWLHPVEIVALVSGCLAAAAFIGFFRCQNLRMTARGPFFILDRTTQVLELPRQGVFLREGQIREFVEVHAWYTERLSDGTNSTWVGELSVLVESEHEKLARYPILTCERTEFATRVVQGLAEFFGVGRRLLKLDWRTRRRLKAETAGRPSQVAEGPFRGQK